jgi:uncharacterized Zn finger protein (UPF0148 family)
MSSAVVKPTSCGICGRPIVQKRTGAHMCSCEAHELRDMWAPDRAEANGPPAEVVRDVRAARAARTDRWVG